jgi:hypothetical protein
MAVSKRHLSGSTSGLPIPVVAVATPGTLLHTAIAGAVGFDEIYFAVANVTNAAAAITIEWGGVTDPTNHLVKGLVIPANSPLIWIPTGLILNGGLIARAFSDVASALNVVGFVNRIQ